MLSVIQPTHQVRGQVKCFEPAHIPLVSGFPITARYDLAIHFDNDISRFRPDSHNRVDARAAKRKCELSIDLISRAKRAPFEMLVLPCPGGAWENQHLEGRTFRTTDQIDAELTFSFRGTGVDAVMRIGPESGNVIVEVDGKVIPGGDGESGDEWDMSWFETLDLSTDLVSGLDYGEHELTIRLVSEGTLTLGGLIVERDQPFVWPIILLTVGALIAMFFGIRSMIMLVGRRSGHLPRADEDPWPALPSMPDWRPGRPS